MSKKIVIVDDSKFTRTILKMPLIKEGYEVISVGDPHEALSRIKAEKPDLIISDLKMPTLIDGLGFLKLLGLEAKTIPVMVYTSEPNAKEVVGNPGLDCIAFLSKPVSPENLKKKVADLIP